MIAGQYVYAADDFFYEIGQGDYAFDPLRLHEAHAVCRERVREALSQGVAKVAVTNTFTESWEAAPYFELAEEFDYVAFVISCESKFENVHGVPESTIAKMAERWDKSLMKPLQKENEGPLAYDPN